MGWEEKLMNRGDSYRIGFFTLLAGSFVVLIMTWGISLPSTNWNLKKWGIYIAYLGLIGLLFLPFLYFGSQKIREVNVMRRDGIAIVWVRVYHVPSSVSSKAIREMLVSKDVEFSESEQEREGDGLVREYRFNGADGRLLTVVIQRNDYQDTSSWVKLISSKYGHENTIMRNNMDKAIQNHFTE